MCQNLGHIRAEGLRFGSVLIFMAKRVTPLIFVLNCVIKNYYKKLMLVISDSIYRHRPPLFLQ